MPAAIIREDHLLANEFASLRCARPCVVPFRKTDADLKHSMSWAFKIIPWHVATPTTQDADDYATNRLLTSFNLRLVPVTPLHLMDELERC